MNLRILLIFLPFFRVLVAEEAQRVYRYSIVEIIIIKQLQKLQYTNWLGLFARLGSQRASRRTRTTRTPWGLRSNGNEQIILFLNLSITTIYFLSYQLFELVPPIILCSGCSRSTWSGWAERFYWSTWTSGTCWNRMNWALCLVIIGINI